VAGTGDLACRVLLMPPVDRPNGIRTCTKDNDRLSRRTSNEYELGINGGRFAERLKTASWVRCKPDEEISNPREQ
jgi:hypothetical protein